MKEAETTLEELLKSLQDQYEKGQKARDDKKAEIEKFLAMSDADLDASIESKDAEIAALRARAPLSERAVQAAQLGTATGERGPTTAAAAPAPTACLRPAAHGRQLVTHPATTITNK